MNMNNADSLCLKSFDPGQKHGPERVALLVANILEKGDKCKATDIYIEPCVNKLQVCFRVDGVILPSTELPRELGPNIIARLKFLANLLSYRQDIPQEGRMGICRAEILQELDVESCTGDFVGWNYLPSIETEQNKVFLEKVKAKLGSDTIVNDSMEAGYYGVYLWVQAVREAKSFEPEKCFNQFEAELFQLLVGLLKSTKTLSILI